MTASCGSSVFRISGKISSRCASQSATSIHSSLNCRFRGRVARSEGLRFSADGIAKSLEHVSGKILEASALLGCHLGPPPAHASGIAAILNVRVDLPAALGGQALLRQVLLLEEPRSGARVAAQHLLAELEPEEPAHALQLEPRVLHQALVPHLEVGKRGPGSPSGLDPPLPPDRGLLERIR